MCKVIDSFMFFNEFDILKLRLKYLNDVVDYFIIVESNYTHSGKSKPYYIDLIWDEISEDIKKKIIRLKYEPNISDITIPNIVTIFDFNNGNWKLEREQRNLISKNLHMFSPNDLFMISDVDEIPNKEVIKKLIDSKINCNFCYAAECKMFYYNFLTYDNEKWAGTIFSSIKNVTHFGCDYFRRQRFNICPIKHGGWHFSYFGDIEQIKYKLDSFAHQEYNKDLYKNDKNISDSIRNKKDLLQRGNNFTKYDFYNFPEQLRNLIIQIFPQKYYIKTT